MNFPMALNKLQKTSLIAICMLSFLSLHQQAQGAQTNIAVAANFTAAAKEIAQAFKQETGHEAILSFGSTGKLYTQIAHGAPFEVFLAADQKRPQKAETEGLGVTGSRFTYASGKIVLYSTDASLIDADAKVLGKVDAFNKIAIANPKTAPYGSAAVSALKKMKLYDTIKSKIVQGDNIAQTHQFVSTGNAQLGFVALSQVIKQQGGSKWLVPQELYAPIRQDGVLLKKGENSEAAKAFLGFLKGQSAHRIIEKYGYAIQ